MDNNATESAIGTTEETANYLQISFSRAPKKNHDAFARLGKQFVQWLNKHGMPGHVTVDTVTFEEEHDGKTKLTSKSSFQTVEDCDIMLNLRVGGGVAARMDRLAELLKYLKYLHKGHHDND